MNETNINRMNELLADEEFAQKIADAGSFENAYDLFAEHGIDASREDFMAYIEECRSSMIETGLLTEDGELSVEMLDMVSGGANRRYAAAAITCWVGGVACVCVGAVVPGAVLICAGCMFWAASRR